VTVDLKPYFTSYFSQGKIVDFYDLFIDVWDKLLIYWSLLQLPVQIKKHTMKQNPREHELLYCCCAACKETEVLQN